MTPGFEAPKSEGVQYATWDEQRAITNSSRKNEAAWLKQKQFSAVDVSGGEWTGMGEFNSDNHYIYYCGHEPLRKNGIAVIVNKKSSKCNTCVQPQK